MARIPYFDHNDAFEDYKKVLNSLEDFNLSKMLAHSPSVIKPYLLLGRSLLTRTELNATTRELVILRVGALLKSDYEFSQHTAIADYLKIPTNIIDEIKKPTMNYEIFNKEDAIVLQLTDDIVKNGRANDNNFQQACSILSNRSVTELVIVIGYYMMTCTFLINFDIDIEPDGQVNPNKILKSS